MKARTDMRSSRASLAAQSCARTGPTLPPMGMDALRGAGKFRGRAAAFTLLELLVVIAIIAILAALLLPALATAKKRATATGCLNNLKELTLAAQLYAGDFADAIIPNGIGGSPGWVAGSVQALPGATNLPDIMSGLLYHYSGSPKIYQCPGDTIILAGSSAPRVRSYSLSCMMGNNEGITGVHDGVVENFKFTSIQMPGPSQALFFVDEQTGTSTDTTSLDDGYFAINYPHGNPAYGGSSGDEYNWRDAPSSRHGDFGQFSFADGHVAKINWLESSTKDLQGGHADGTSPVDLDYKQIWQSIYPPSNW